MDLSAFQAALEDAKGKITVINFWATWCPPCLKEMPELIAFHKEYAPKDIVFLSVSVDHPETIEQRVRPYLEKNKLPFGVHVINESDPAKIGKALGTDYDGAVPATFLLDPNGRVRKSWSEEITAAELGKAVEEAQ